MGMLKGACIINGTKGMIDEEGLAKALRMSDLKYALTLPDNYELLKEFGNRVFATPKKMGAQTAEANINAGLAAVRQIADFLQQVTTNFR